MPREPMSDSTSVAPMSATGTIRLRTPEGQEFEITVERACEWLSDCRFRDRLKRACHSMPVPYSVVETEGEGR